MILDNSIIAHEFADKVRNFLKLGKGPDGSWIVPLSWQKLHGADIDPEIGMF